MTVKKLKKRNHTKVALFAGAAALMALAPNTHAQSSVTPAVDSDSTAWQKPVWLTALSIGVRESYDDNVLLVSGDGMAPQSSWVTTVSPKVGFNFAPLLGNTNTTNTLQTLSFN